MVVKGKGTGGKHWEFGISRCKLLYIGWINNKVLLYSTVSYIQYPVMDHDGGAYEKEYVCAWLSHFAIQQELTQHCKSSLPQ